MVTEDSSSEIEPMLPPDSNVVIAEPEPGALPSEPGVVEEAVEDNS